MLFLQCKHEREHLIRNGHGKYLMAIHTLFFFFIVMVCVMLALRHEFFNFTYDNMFLTAYGRIGFLEPKKHCKAIWHKYEEVMKANRVAPTWCDAFIGSQVSM